MKSSLIKKAPPGRLRSPRPWIALFAIFAMALAPQPLWSQDPFIRDTTMDTGVEPNPDTGPMWVSPDIWVRNTPDPNYDPAPYPIGSPPWTPQPHEDPEYDDPKTGFPAYVYVRIRNRGASATTGTERLRVYWAKASTGLSWPTQWVDYLDTSCGPTVLHGMEVTKPRRNAASVSAAERTAYIDALVDIDGNPSLQFSDGVQYWDKQNVIHDIGGAQHGVPAFLPWHREFLNRLEVLMRESDPLLTLLYWDWTTDPTTGTSLFTTSFMGASSGTVGAPLIPLRPPTLQRDVGVSSFSPDSDASILGAGTYPTLAVDIEAVPNHNRAHGYIGGPSGQISFLNTAAQDPFFFLLHGNVDRLWAQWQQDPTATARIDPASAYGTDSTHASITNNMNPWAGSLTPWSSPTWQALKSPLHPSVVFPPIYDTAPLTIPVLQPNEEAIVQVPWFPPDPADFSCFGDSGHFCLLARIETSTTAPFGMTFAEGASVGTNTRNNNNIAWKNLTVVDNVARLRFLSAEIIRNYFEFDTLIRVTFRVPKPGHYPSFWDHGDVYLTLPNEFAGRWNGDGVTVEGTNENGKGFDLAITRDDAYVDLPMAAKQSIAVGLAFDVRPETAEQNRKDPFLIDMIQTGPGAGGTQPGTIMGGQRFQLDLSKLTLVDNAAEWAVLPGANLEDGWQSPEFDDSAWRRGRAPFLLHGAAGSTTYFRKTFSADDPSVYYLPRLKLQANDGAVVYLNGKEIQRRNLPTGLIASDTFATRKTRALEKRVYWEEPVSIEHLLQEGDNTIAVEVHQAEGGDPEVRFDLALTANQTVVDIPPTVQIAAPANGSHFVVGDPIDLKAEALDQDGKVERIDLFVDGELIDSKTSSPASAVIGSLEPGTHRIEALVTDSSGATARHMVRVTVHPWLPPLVEITRPGKHATIPAGEPFTVNAEILSAPSAPVKQVELFVKEGQFVPTGFDLVTSPNFPAVATATSPPYELTISGLPPGMHMLQVSATDAAGHVGVSSHVMIMVQDLEGGPSTGARDCNRRDVDGGCMELRLVGDQDGDGVDNRFDFCPDSLLSERSAEPDQLKALGGCVCYQIAEGLGLPGQDCTPAMLEQWKDRLSRVLQKQQ